jgi:hypothetical protein
MLNPIKKLLLLLFAAALLPCSSVGQSADKGNIQVELGGGLGAYFYYSNIDFGKGIGAVSTVGKFKIDYTVQNQFSLALQGRLDKYIVQGDSTTSFVDAGSGAIFFTGNYHLVNKEKFNFYVGAGVGIGGIGYSETDTAGNVGTFAAGGIPFIVDVGIRKYFKEHLGFFVTASWVNYPVSISELTVNGETRNFWSGRAIENINFNLAGINLVAGLALKF